MTSGNVLVTGGSGFLASHCILKLLQQGYRVRTTVRALEKEQRLRASLAHGGGVPGERLRVFAADLNADAGWSEAAAGCDYLLHVASPFPPAQPTDPDDLIRPARDGTLRVLRAAKAAGVKRVVLTSSFAAIGYGQSRPSGLYTEADWTDLSKDLTPYIRSKTVAERAAWDFVVGEGAGLELTAVNPVGIFGPLLGPDLSASVTMVKRMLDGRVPAVPRLMFGMVDVRDCADLHLLAMTSPAAAGQRFLCSAGDFLTVQQMARALRDGLGVRARRVPTRVLPDWVVRLAALFSATARQAATPDLGRFKNASSAKAREVLGWAPRSPQEALVATGESLFALGLVKA